MAPTKPMSKQPLTLSTSTLTSHIPVKTRNQLPAKKEPFSKRKAEGSPLKRLTVKRSAFGDLTNADIKENVDENNIKNVVKKIGTKPLVSQNLIKLPLNKPKEIKKTSVLVPNVLKKNPCPLPTVKPVLTVKQDKNKSTVVKVQENVPTVKLIGPVTRSSTRRSSVLEKTSETSLYVSALEALDLEDKQKSAGSKPKVERKPPPGVEDYDKETLEDLPSVAIYAMDIFDYLKSREKDFIIEDYLAKQTHLTPTMRALLVDWMVDVQENFELNHETLYLAVKIVDLYLTKAMVRKEILQLLGCVGMFIASKYDERLPPSIEDFLYLTENTYTASDLTSMEVKVLKTLDFNLGVPLSYRFLRRYARCIKAKMPLLTLARYILEYALMDYAMIRYSDSKIAAAALLLALIMKGSGWSATLEYYSGYKTEDLKDLVIALNVTLHKKVKENLKTIRTKYAHMSFFQVALTPLVDNINL